MPKLFESTLKGNNTGATYRILTTGQSDGSYKTIIHRMNKELDHSMIVFEDTFKTKKEALSVHSDYITLLG